MLTILMLWRHWKFHNTKTAKICATIEALTAVAIMVGSFLSINTIKFMPFMLLYGLGLEMVLDAWGIFELCSLYDTGWSPELVPQPT